MTSRNLFPKHSSVAKGSSKPGGAEIWWGMPDTRWMKLIYRAKMYITVTENRSFVTR